ncbi:MAG: hypothetical protein Q4C47_01000, partial [Planctomycetia bacterium]|nr:hypothetical protein [Planctomycetia bacterium]
MATMSYGDADFGDLRYSGISRRRFLELAAATGSVGMVPAFGAFCTAQDDAGPDTSANTGEVTDCGPPPQAAPQHRGGAEGFPPLPLPVTPLRRTEKKRPPSPPALIGKMSLGNAKWVTKDGKRTLTRDWMTDPADLDTLLELIEQAERP